MDLRIQLILWFTAGVAIESLCLIRRNPGAIRFGLCFGVGLAVAAFSDHNGNANRDDAHYAIAYLAYAGMFGFLFRKDILPVVSEKLLLALTVLFWYGLATIFHRGMPSQQVVMGLTVLPSSVTVYVALFRPALGFWLKLFLYAWFLTIVVSLGLLQFPYGNLQIFTVHQVPWLNAADALVTGVAFMYLVVNGQYLFLLIPIPGKTQSFQDRMKEWHELTDLMTQRCAQDEPTHLQALMVVGTIASVAIVNYTFQLISAPLLISGTLVACAIWLHVGTAESVLASTAAASDQRLPGGSRQLLPKSGRGTDRPHLDG